MHTQIKHEIIERAKASPQTEICGFIVRDAKGRPKVFPCRNISSDPERTFEIDVKDHISAMGVGTLLGAYHSHPGDPKGFSRGDPAISGSSGDIEFADNLALPAYLVNVRDSSWYSYVPATYRVPTVGRQWCLGFNDCFETPRVYYRNNFRIFLNDYDRDESFIHEEQGVIMNSYEKEGFVTVDVNPTKIQIHDILMFRTDKLVPQHFAVFVGGGGYMVHHRIGELSRQEQITDQWWDRLIGVFRHKTLIRSDS